MAVRICPLCGTTLESYPGTTLKARAKEHYFIAHKDYVTEEQKEIWESFYNSLPGSIEIMDILPAPPTEGPPLPKALRQKWPWRTEHSNPSPLIHPATVDTEIDSLIASKRAEWEAKGYRPGLINKALTWAREWAWGLLKSPLYREIIGHHPELEVEITKSLYKTGLEQAEKWMSAFKEI